MVCFHYIEVYILQLLSKVFSGFLEVLSGLVIIKFGIKSHTVICLGLISRYGNPWGLSLN